MAFFARNTLFYCGDYIFSNICEVSNMSLIRLKELKERIKRLELASSIRLTLLNLFELMRYDYFHKYNNDIGNLLVKADIKIPIKNVSAKQEKLLYDIINEEGLNWGDTSFHLTYRVQIPNDLIDLRPELESKKKRFQMLLTIKDIC